MQKSLMDSGGDGAQRFHFVSAVLWPKSADTVQHSSNWTIYFSFWLHDDDDDA